MKKRKYAILDSLYVKEDFRRKGIGKLLISNAVDWIKSKNINEIELNVWDFIQGAIKFYSRIGFKVISHIMLIDNIDDLDN